MRAGIIILLFLISGISYGQQRDKIYLKNGSRLKGEIININPEDTLEVRISTSSVLLPLQLVEEIRFRRRNGTKIDRYQDYTYQQGFFKGFNAGVLLGSHSNAEAPDAQIMLEGLFEYHYHPLLNLGIGTGINEYDDYLISPLFLQYKLIFSRKIKSLYAYGRAGYGFVIGKDHEENIDEVDEGRLLAAGIGYQTRIRTNYLSFQAGYHSQRITEELFNSFWRWSWPEYKNKISRERNMNRVVFSVSYMF